MSTKLIALLTRHVKKSPDEIVTHLQNKGWLLGKNFKKADKDRMAGKSVKLCIVNGDNYVWGPNSYVFEWSLHDVTHSLATYYFILTEDYVDGELPQPSGPPSS